MGIDLGWRGAAPAVRRGVLAQWAVTVVVLAVAVVGRAGAGRSTGLVVAALGVGMSLVVLGGPPRLRATARRWPSLWRGSAPAVPWPVPWAGSPAATGGRVDASGAAPGLHWRGRLLVMLDVRTGTSGGPLPVGVRALQPLLQTSGIVVEAIQWIRWIQQEPAAFDGTRSDDDLEPAGAGAPPPRCLLILRIDPMRNEESIRGRGGGDVGVQRLTAATVTRAAALLAPHGLRPRPLDTDAALQVLSDLVGDVRGPAAGSAGRRAGPVRLEHRRHLVASAGTHRLLRWSAGGPDGAAARRAGDVRYDDATMAGAVASFPGQVVVSQWIRAGPGGMVAGGAVRLSARAGGELDRLERDVRRRLGPKAADLRVAVDEQWPSFLATLPLGGP